MGNDVDDGLCVFLAGAATAGAIDAIGAML
jgi:hypothetical protein